MTRLITLFNGVSSTAEDFYGWIMFSAKNRFNGLENVQEIDRFIDYITGEILINALKKEDLDLLEFVTEDCFKDKDSHELWKRCKLNAYFGLIEYFRDEHGEAYQKHRS